MNKTRSVRSSLVWLVFGIAVVFTAVVGALSLRSGTEDALNRDNDAVVRGSFMTWEVITECERGSDPCTLVLDKYNERLRPDGMEIYEDGSLSVLSR